MWKWIICLGSVIQTPTRIRWLLKVRWIPVSLFFSARGIVLGTLGGIWINAVKWAIFFINSVYCINLVDCDGFNLLPTVCCLSSFLPSQQSPGIHLFPTIPSPQGKERGWSHLKLQSCRGKTVIVHKMANRLTQWTHPASFSVFLEEISKEISP